eukprot:gnl/TRDRNA2_/TRDRNA2_177168_c3_seq2.p1 gnl/TRDRNA2_/TRDRNA2_177168_c3~~gnl/TRDRNA2_/TRDRNA2_177168_c3_seq2.p1  ORF type:complete len:582 (-),score=85.87 gnl/TRDRNA2_/TRDRNA2_177168_c3_seq2:365-2110(-)
MDALPEFIVEKLQMESARLRAELDKQIEQHQQAFALVVAEALKAQSGAVPQKSAEGPSQLQPAPEESQLSQMMTTQAPSETRPAADEFQRQGSADLLFTGVIPVAPNGCIESEGQAKFESENSMMASEVRQMVIERKLTEQKLLAEEHSMSTLERIVGSRRFELGSAGLIVANTIIMGVNIQYKGFQTGYVLNVPAYDSPSVEVWPGAEAVFEQLESVFNISFIVELVVRFAALRTKSIHSGWMWFDTTIVTLGTLDWLGLMGNIGLDPSLMRLFRLLRLLRMLKLLQKLTALESLFVLIRSIKASFGALCWSFVLLLLMQLMMALLVCQLLAGFINDEFADVEKRQQVFIYFGTFTNSVLSMFEISLANWVPISRLLKNNVDEGWVVFFVIYRCMICFGVIKTISAVFIAETNKAAAEDMDIVMMKKHKEKAKYCEDLKRIFIDLDHDGNGVLSREEFEIITRDDFMKAWFGHLQIDTSDLDHLFQIFDSGDGRIQIEEFINGVQHMKGFAKSMDVLALVKMGNAHRLRIEEINNTLKRMPELISASQTVNMPALQEVIKKEVAKLMWLLQEKCLEDVSI